MTHCSSVPRISVGGRPSTFILRCRAKRSSIQYCVRVSLIPVEVCKVSIGARTPQQASETCSCKTRRFSTEDRGFPTYNCVQQYCVVVWNDEDKQRKVYDILHLILFRCWCHHCRTYDNCDFLSHRRDMQPRSALGCQSDRHPRKHELWHRARCQSHKPKLVSCVLI
jgi:hypothetical protein